MGRANIPTPAGAARARRKAPTVCAALFAASLCCAIPQAKAAPSVSLQISGRTFGYFIGDTIDATATVTAEPSAVLDTASLPAQGPISTWIDLRRLSATQDRGSGASRVVLHMQYQSFFDPEEASQGSVPGFDITLLSQGQHLAVHIPGFGFMASPFRHVLQPVIESAALQPDHGFLTIPLAGLKLRMTLALAAAFATATLLAARLGLLPALGGRARPFAAAAHRIVRLARSTDTGEAARQSMLELHRAFDATAGSRVLAPDLDGFFARHSRFVPLQPEIERFFASSANFFFGPVPQEPGQALHGLAALGRRLRRAERAP